MSTRAKYLNAAGTIVDGRIRDLQEHRDLNYPVSPGSGLGMCRNQSQVLTVRKVFARDVGTTAPQELLRVSEVCLLF